MAVSLGWFGCDYSANICQVLFIFFAQVAHQDIDIDCKEFIIGHGKSAWLKAEKVANMECESAVVSAVTCHSHRSPLARSSFA